MWRILILVKLKKQAVNGCQTQYELTVAWLTVWHRDRYLSVSLSKYLQGIRVCRLQAWVGVGKGEEQLKWKLNDSRETYVCNIFIRINHQSEGMAYIIHFHQYWRKALKQHLQLSDPTPPSNQTQTWHTTFFWLPHKTLKWSINCFHILRQFTGMGQILAADPHVEGCCRLFPTLLSQSGSPDQPPTLPG